MQRSRWLAIAFVAAVVMSAGARAETPMTLVVRSLSWTRAAATQPTTASVSSAVQVPVETQTSDEKSTVGIILRADFPGSLQPAPAEAKEDAAYRVVIVPGQPFDVQVNDSDYQLHLKGILTLKDGIGTGKLSVERQRGRGSDQSVESVSTSVHLPLGGGTALTGCESGFPGQPLQVRQWQVMLEKAKDAKQTQ